MRKNLATAELKRESDPKVLNFGTARGMWQKRAGAKNLRSPPPE